MCNQWETSGPRQGWIQSSSSDLQKSLKFFSKLYFSALYCSSWNQLSFLFYCLLWNKTEEKLFRWSHSKPSPPPEQIGRVSVCTVSSFVDTSENNAKKIRRHDWTKFLPREWGLDVHGSFHKSLKTHFDWSESLTLSCELLKLSYDWLFRSQTTMQTTDNHI